MPAEPLYRKGQVVHMLTHNPEHREFGAPDYRVDSGRFATVQGVERIVGTTKTFYQYDLGPGIPWMPEVWMRHTSGEELRQHPEWTGVQIAGRIWTEPIREIV